MWFPFPLPALFFSFTLEHTPQMVQRSPSSHHMLILYRASPFVPAGCLPSVSTHASVFHSSPRPPPLPPPFKQNCLKKLQLDSYVRSLADVIQGGGNNAIAISPDVCSSTEPVAKDCVACGCNAAGSKKKACDQDTGACTCKRFVQGKLCSECKDGFSFLDTANEDGCSGTPSKFAAPSVAQTSSSTVEISWKEPGESAGPVINYTVYRDDEALGSVNSSTFRFIDDDDVEKGVTYNYHVDASTVAAAGSSDTSSITLERKVGQDPICVCWDRP